MALIAMMAAAGGPVMAAPDVTGDVEVLAGPCAFCHGPQDGRQGVSQGDIPSIAGRDSGDLRDRMLAYRAGDSDATATIMPRLMRGYSADEIARLADYFAGLAP